MQIHGANVTREHIIHVMEQCALEEQQQATTVDIAAHEKNMEPIELKMDYWQIASQEKCN